MNEQRYIVSYHHPGFVGASKIYKYRKSAFTYVHKLKNMFGADNIVVMVEHQELKDKKWIMKDRWFCD